VLAHPWSANFPRDATRVFCCRELEDQNQMCVIDLRQTSRERACIHDELHPLACRLYRRIRHRFAQTKMVNHNVQALDAIASSPFLLSGHSATLAPAQHARAKLRGHSGTLAQATAASESGLRPIPVRRSAYGQSRSYLDRAITSLTTDMTRSRSVAKISWPARSTGTNRPSWLSAASARCAASSCSTTLLQ
jgi:hypothetical protein